MALSSKGSKAWIIEVKSVLDGKGTNVVIQTNTKISEGKYGADFVYSVFLWDKGVQVNKGDMIEIRSFYLRNCARSMIFKAPSITITEWEIVARNAYKSRLYKKKSKEEVEQEKLRQRQEIEEEIEAEEQDFDEYIENNGEDDCPF